MAVEKIEIDYLPRRYFLPFHERTERNACIVAHRAAGKTVACVNDLQRDALTSADKFAYIAPSYKQAKAVAWDYLKNAAWPLFAFGARCNESELRIDYPNGGQVRLFGADNYDSLRGLHLAGALLDEFADFDPRAWPEVIRPALAHKRGRVTFIGTPKGHNEFHKIWVRSTEEPDWYSLVLRASDTNILGEDELERARRDLTPEQYAQEYECSFEAAIVGAYYGRELADAERDGRIRAVPVDEAVPVHTAWDLGIGDSTAIWFFQVVANEIHIVDWYENSGVNLDHYLSVLADRGYGYGIDFVPHDAKARELISGRSRVEYLSDKGRKLQVVARDDVEDGINAARLTLPRCFFDKTKCAQGIEALRQYRTEYDEKARAFKNNPRHDWTSHTADAFRYLAMGWREYEAPNKPNDVLQEIVKPKTLDQIIKQFEMEQLDAD